MKKRNIIFIVCSLTTFILLLCTVTYAGTINPNSFKPGSVTTSGVGGAINLAEKIIGGITAVGTVVAVVVTLALGIKYMLGSIEQRAEYKKSMMPILFGMMMLFGVSWIIKLIYNIMTGINV